MFRRKASKPKGVVVEVAGVEATVYLGEILDVKASFDATSQAGSPGTFYMVGNTVIPVRFKRFV